MIYALFAGTVWQTAHQGRSALVELGWTCLYGLVLEWLTIRVLHAYQYGHFLMMIGDIPLCIGLGWGIVIDFSMRFTDRFHLAQPIRPIAAALMGLSIDLALDVIAIRVGLWHWTGVQLDQQWFGVPWANFVGWFMVIWSYAGCIWALRSWQGRSGREWLYPPLGLVLSLVVLLVASVAYPAMSASIGSGLTPILLIVGCLVLVACSSPRLVPGQLQPPMALLIPIAFHGFAVFVGIRAGIFAQQPVLAAVEVLVFTIGLGVDWLPFWSERWHKWRIIGSAP